MVAVKHSGVLFARAFRVSSSGGLGFFKSKTKIKELSKREKPLLIFTFIRRCCKRLCICIALYGSVRLGLGRFERERETPWP